MKKRIATLKDIANVAGVSPMTVSRALNNTSYVHKDTKRRIVEIAGDLNYHPNRIARSLASNKSHLIGLIVSNIKNQFFSELARGIEDKARNWGYNIIFSSTDNKPENLESSIQMMLEIGVDGMIITSARLHEPVIEKLIRQDFPIVLANRRLKQGKSNYVVMDNHHGGYLATSHLIRCGYSRIGIIAGPTTFSAGLDRLEGYKSALIKHNIALNSELIQKGMFSKEFGLKAGLQLLELKNRPDAIFATNDDIALGVMKAAHQMGIRIPQDLGLIGFDDTEISAHPNINLTTIRQKKYEMGELGVQLLKDLIERDTVHYTNQIVLEPELVVRQSCGFHLRPDQKGS